ncbi:TetR/AcrR family transcriptional regulator [Rhodanobacter aciditrophus]|uniref:TetR/AcrR family transcriptional regulator n=1 Tax=Rhodanobacter aciditrophus TaxID=1623218 RepID=A0ABW4B3J5_9GAMM
MTPPRKRLITHDRLRTSVQNLLLETNWREITVQHVAEQAGVSIGTFYNYYDSKDEALRDVRNCLSEMIKKDVFILLNTQPGVENRISILIKYFINILNTKPTWANYFYRADCFSERLDGGLVALLEPLILESALFQKSHFTDANIAARFVENGLFPLLKSYHHKSQTVPEEEATQIVVLALSAMGLIGDSLNSASSLVCPLTPLNPLPQSIFELERAQAGYA